jgi:hypothetical protein
MTILSALVTLLGQSVGGIATTTLGWAVVHLFGRVPASRQQLLASIGFGSLVWLIAVVAVLVPAIGGALVSSLPRPAGMPFDWLRLGLLGAALFLPLAIGVGTIFVVEPADRPTGWALVGRILRGYPFALVLATVIVFLSILRLDRRVRSLQRGWVNEHLPMIVKPGRYAAVVDEVEAAVVGAGLPVRRTRPSPLVEGPPRLLALVGGADGETPDELVELDLDGLSVLILPSDVALVGPADLVARARAAIVRRLTYADVYLTNTEESQEVEDQLAEIARQSVLLGADLRPIDEALEAEPIPFEAWQALLRLRLQVENDARLPDRAASLRTSAATPPLDVASRSSTIELRGAPAMAAPGGVARAGRHRAADGDLRTG